MEEEFLRQLAEGIIFAAGPARYSEERALEMARQIWAELKAHGPEAYPCMAEVEQDDLRFVYQWDEDPPLLTIMLWDEVMWRDMVRIQVPPGVA